ncbi:MAG TPA: hypothetical protein VK712_01760 [Verrucomicrobiae bacterium]|jgi:hypothetical protein|nr:hypothetical protein [Verrucomicrobiae bacterium]
MSKTLTIKQPNTLRGSYEVYDGGNLVASLKTNGLFKKKGLATIQGQEWEFTLPNPLGRSIVATSSTSPAVIFKTDFLRSSGDTQINSEKYFYKRVTNKISPAKIKPLANVWLNDNQEEIITLHFNTLMKREGTAIVSDTALATNADYLLLMLLALFRLRVEYSRSM